MNINIDKLILLWAPYFIFYMFFKFEWRMAMWGLADSQSMKKDKCSAFAYFFLNYSLGLLPSNFVFEIYVKWIWGQGSPFWYRYIFLQSYSKIIFYTVVVQDDIIICPRQYRIFCQPFRNFGWKWKSFGKMSQSTSDYFVLVSRWFLRNNRS